MKITMKREEEIEKASVEYQMSKNPMALGGDAFDDMVYRANINPSFIAGAKWADKTMLDKACEWLKEVFSVYEDLTDYNPMEDFRKAMEE